MTHPNLNELATRIHAQNKAAGVWDDPRPRAQSAWLVVTKLAEATEAQRGGRSADLNALESTFSAYKKTIGQKPEIETDAFRTHVKGTFEDKIASAVIRVLDFAESEEVKIPAVKRATAPYTEIAFFRVTEKIWDAVHTLNNKNAPLAGEHLSVALRILFAVADWHEFDLWKHVELKLRYNRTHAGSAAVKDSNPC